MGWTYLFDPVDDSVAYLTAECTCDGERRSLHVLDAARVGKTVYMAVKSTDKARGTSYVFAAVILISNTKKMASATRTWTRAWVHANAHAPSASCACLPRLPICRTPAMPPNGAPRLLLTEISSAGSGNCAGRFASAAPSQCQPRSVFAAGPRRANSSSPGSGAKRRSSCRSTDLNFTAA